MANVYILYPQKTLKKTFSGVYRGFKNGTLSKNGLNWDDLRDLQTHKIVTSQLIYKANQWAGFYMLRPKNLQKIRFCNQLFENHCYYIFQKLTDTELLTFDDFLLVLFSLLLSLCYYYISHAKEFFAQTTLKPSAKYFSQSPHNF